MKGRVEKRILSTSVERRVDADAWILTHIRPYIYAGRMFDGVVPIHCGEIGAGYSAPSKSIGRPMLYSASTRYRSIDAIRTTMAVGYTEA